MSKRKLNNKVLVSLIPVIVFIVYTVITFLIWGDNKESGFWFGWFFSLVATVITAGLPYLLVKKGEEVKSLLNSFSVYYITLIYFVAQLVVGFICMIFNEGPMALLVVLEVILHAVYAFFIIASVMGKNTISDLEQHQKEKVYFVKSIAADLGLVAGKIQDEELKKKVEKVQEIARYSDPMSHQSLAGVEATISTKVEELKNAVDEGKTEGLNEIVDKIEEKFTERNEKCKLLK